MIISSINIKNNFPMPIKKYIVNSHVKLIEALEKMQNKASKEIAAYYNLKKLNYGKYTKQILDVASNYTVSILENLQGSVFYINDEELIFIGDKEAAIEIGKIDNKLKYLFQDISETKDFLSSNNNIITIFDLNNDWDIFKKTVDSLIYSKDNKVKLSNQFSESQILDAKSLAKIIATLDSSNISHLLRAQPVCLAKSTALASSKDLKLVFKEIYTNLKHLTMLVDKEIDIYSNKILLSHLTTILDERVLKLIKTYPNLYLKEPISLNLNIDTIFGQYFADFDNNIQEINKRSIVIEISVGDIFYNMKNYMLAYKYLKKLGYKVCIDGVDIYNIFFIKENIPADFIKVQWIEGEDADSKEEIAKLKQHIISYNPKRIIFCRCSNKQAIEFGQEVGISIFQGWYIDKLINPDIKNIN